MKTAVCKTDQIDCYDIKGKIIPCADTGQDGALRVGVTWPEPRFKDRGATVVDNLTGLIWTKDAGVSEFPLMWQEAFDFVKAFNKSGTHGTSDWRLPNRKELFSLLSHTVFNPSLPSHHPFVNIFSGYYWTSTTCARLPAQAWYVHLGGGRIFKGMKHASYMTWPVRGGLGGRHKLPRTGQETCFNEEGKKIACAGSMQDGALQMGEIWPVPRFNPDRDIVEDNLTGLVWTQNARHAACPMNWEEAFDYVGKMNREKTFGYSDWRLPNIRELESLTDMESHTPALPRKHPFERVQEWYWSSTTSIYNPEYAWVLYMVDGGIGVGYKQNTDSYVWPVRGKGI